MSKEADVHPETGPSFSPDFDLDFAVARYRSGDEVGAVPLFQKLADAGSAPAMTWVGYVYLEGRGVPVDTEKAFT